MVKVETKVNRYGDGLTSDVMLDGGRFGLYSVGGVGKGQSGRKVFQGKLVPGPWHYIGGMATCIAANPENGTYGDIKRAKAAGLYFMVAPGDEVEIDGIVYRVTRNFGGTGSVLILEGQDREEVRP